MSFCDVTFLPFSILSQLDGIDMQNTVTFLFIQFVFVNLLDGCYSDVTGIGLGLLAVYLRWVLDPPLQVQPVNLVLSAQQDAQTVTVYMLGLVLLTVVFLIAARRPLLQMVRACGIILLAERTG